MEKSAAIKLLISKILKKNIGKGNRMKKKNENFRNVRNETLYDVHAVFGDGQCIHYENKHVHSDCQHGMSDEFISGSFASHRLTAGLLCRLITRPSNKGLSC